VERNRWAWLDGRALLGCKALVWNASTFETLSEKFPTLQRNAMRILTRRLLELEGRLFEISTERVAPRLAVNWFGYWCMWDGEWMALSKSTFRARS